MDKLNNLLKNGQACSQQPKDKLNNLLKNGQACTYYIECYDMSFDEFTFYFQETKLRKKLEDNFFCI